MAITTQMFEQDRWFHEKAEHEIRERERAAFEAGMAQGGQLQSIVDQLFPTASQTGAAA